MPSPKSPLKSLWILLGGLATFVFAMVLTVHYFTNGGSVGYTVGVGALGLVSIAYVILFFAVVFAVPLLVVALTSRRKVRRNDESHKVN